MSSSEPVKAVTIFVDAQTGRVTKMVDDLRDSSIAGTVTASYWPAHNYDTPVTTTSPTTNIRLYNIAGQLVGSTNTNSKRDDYISGFA